MAKIDKARVLTHKNDELFSQIEYDVSIFSAYQYNRESSLDGLYVCRDGVNGYYYHTVEGSKKYNQYTGLSDLDINDSNNEFIKAFNLVSNNLYFEINQEMSFTSGRNSAKYYSNGDIYFRSNF